MDYKESKQQVVIVLNSTDAGDQHQAFASGTARQVSAGYPSYQGLEIIKFPMRYGRKAIARFRCYSSMVVVKQWQDISLKPKAIIDKCKNVKSHT
jgi:hypothetical protein